MRFKSPSLPELHAFLAVCKLGSFRKAADMLFVTQAGVSRAVLRLEQHLGCVLLDRTGPRVVPTARGHEYRALIEAHVSGLESAFEQFGMTCIKHKLRLSIAPTLGTRWLVPRLPQFFALHPGIEIEFRQFYYDENFSRNDVDIWIEIKRPARAWPRGIRARYLMGREIVPACTPALAKSLREPKDLLKTTLLQHTNYPGNWALWLTQVAGIETQPPPGPGFDLGSNLIVAACAGMGVIVIQPELIEQEVASGQLVLPFRQSASTDRGYYICSRSVVSTSVVAEHFINWTLGAAEVSAVRCIKS